ncbi:hypothetical protein ACB092_04G063100 [Castanea dentata]
MSLRLLCPIHFQAILLLFIALLHVKIPTIFAGSSTSTFSYFGGNETDHQALLAFKKQITHDPENILSSWNDSLHFCEWEGVTCGHKHRRVTVLNLRSRGLVGSLSPYIGNLSFIRVIQLNNNTIGGQIVDEVGRLLRLRWLGLSINSFQGKIPANLSHCSKLKYLEELASLSKLGFLFVRNNNLTGGIPPFIGNLSSLQVFSASINAFGGHIPEALGQLESLNILTLGDNKLSGLIPPSLYNCSSITFFTMSENELSGSLPTNLFLTLPHLQWFQIYSNQFTGSLPVSLSNASELQYFAVYKNNFMGKISNNFGGLHHLVEFVIDYNNFGSGDDDEMNFLQPLLNCSSKLPNVFGNLSTQLTYFAIGHNLIFGEIPLGMGNLVNLTTLLMNNNKFTGTIPDDISSLKKLQLLDLSNNKLSGRLPITLGNLSLLNKLFLDNNILQGTIPPRSLPSEVGNLVHLSVLNLSENKLSGKIPSSLGFCTSLEYLYVEGNLFQGEIPTSLSSLSGIQVMDLSRNNFSSQIPNFLEKLSQVPTKGVFANASAISVIENSRLCGGISELMLPSCLTKKEKKRKWSLTLTIVISVACVLLVVATVSFFIFYWHKNIKKDESLGSTMRKSLLKVSYQMLLKATDGFGSVYKGILGEDGSIVAVKVLNLQRQGAFRSFISECDALKNIRHRNLVKIITSCSSVDFQGNDFKALVYEFMPNGSLEKWLHMDLETDTEQAEIQNLNLLQRTNIAIDVACALDYLHHHCPVPVVHCDLKPTHVGDFGLAKFLSELTIPKQSSSIGIRGTIGYTPPEYGLGSEVSTKGDVYSYGILLLEMITGKRPTDHMFEGGSNLHNYASMALPNCVLEIVDSKLLNNVDEVIDNHNFSPTNRKEECLISMVKVGVACSMELPQERWDISKAISELHLVKDILLGSRS